MQKSAIALATLFLLSAAWAQKPDAPGSPAPAKAINPPSVETRAYKGTLVDASCAANVTQKAPAAETSTADRADAGNTPGQKSGSEACAVSSSTKEFALKTKEGRVLRFDAVGNERTADALKNKKNWSAAMSAGKPITAKVGGSSLDGDNLTVLTID